MKALPLVILAAALSIGAAQPKSDVVEVEIVLGEHKSHEARCAKGGVIAHTILIDDDAKKEVHHCLDKALHNHGDHEASSEHGAVRVFAGQRIRWFSTTTDFSVESVRKPKTANYKPQDPSTPDPLFKSFQQKDKREVYSPIVPDLPGTKVIFQLYKTTFRIGNDLVDPDVVCGM